MKGLNEETIKGKQVKNSRNGWKKEGTNEEKLMKEIANQRKRRKWNRKYEWRNNKKKQKTVEKIVELTRRERENKIW